MKDKLRTLVSNKMFHLVVIIVIIVAILFFLGITILKYNVEGETNMPFVLSKISIISQSLGTDKTVEGMRWAFDVNETNDIYLYIDKNEGNNQEELIKSVKIDSMNVNTAPTVGQTNFYKPDVTDVNLFFKDSAENVINSLEYAGDVESDIKNLKISNQGGIVAFRYSINNVAEYTSNDDEQIEHKDLLNKAGVKIDSMNVNTAPTVGQTNFYKPDVTDVNLFFKDSAENVINSLEYAGDVESDIKNLKISNQGGIVAFRYSINNVAEYTSNDDEQIEHKDLLNKAGVDYNNLKSNISFDLTINLESGKVFKSNINLDLPLDNVVQEGVVSKEITDVEQFIFKRIQN